jgi:gamma-glutamyltranspeptidase/glutathione hydrolase
MAMRPTVYGTRHAVATGHYLASAVAFSILEAGGNAVDAGCAAGITLSVLHPDIVSFGGVAPIIIRMAGEETITIAGLGWWPKGLPADLFMREHGGIIPHGLLRTVVPAAPDAWITALMRHGTMSFGEVAASAIRFALEGFAVHDHLAHFCRTFEKDYGKWPVNAALFAPGGVPLKAGQKLVQTDLGNTISYMAEEEKAHARGDRLAGLQAARDAFYKGDIARTMTRFHAENGGYLTMADLADYASPVEKPLSVEWRGNVVQSCGPWCQGPALLQALLQVEAAGLDGLEHNSAAYLHLVVEALKLAFADREAYFGDPAFVDVPMEHLLSGANIAARARMIDPNAAFPGMPAPSDLTERPIAASDAPLPEASIDTTYIAVVDRWGNAFSATPSDSTYAAPIIPGLGFLPSGRGAQSRGDPAHPAGAFPGKRPRLTPAPMMMLTADGGVVPFGTPGGDVQVQAMLQVLLNVFHFGMEMQDAVEAPRVSTYSFPSSFSPFDYRPGRLAVEGRIPFPVREALAALGHKIETWPDFNELAGCVEMVRTYPARGLISACADPRRPAYAIAT